jgi:hypothetical protein
MREPSNFLNARPLGETNDSEIRRMDPKNQLCPIVNRALVIGDSSSVGRPNFAQRDAALCHYIGYSKATADLNQLASRDDYFAAFRKRVKNEHHGGRVVVDENRGFTSSQPRQQLLAMGFSFSPLASTQVVLEI